MDLLQKDLKEFVELLLENNVEFVVVGAYALAFHGHPRYTQDIDLFVKNSTENAKRILAAIQQFGFGSLDISERDFQHPDQIIQLGMPPNRIDLLKRLSGVDFEQVWKGKVEGTLADLSVHFIGREEYIANKRAAGRSKDIADADALES